MLNYIRSDPASLEFIEIVPEDQLTDGQRLFINIGSRSIVLFNNTGRLFAIADICSHDNGPLGDGQIDGNEIICPRHGARFDIYSGRAVSLPAVVDIPVYPVRVIEGVIQIGVPVIAE